MHNLVEGGLRGNKLGERGGKERAGKGSEGTDREGSGRRELKGGEETYTLDADVVGVSVDGGEGSHFDVSLWRFAYKFIGIRVE